MRKMAGEQQGENAATEALGQHCHSNLGAWGQSCRWKALSIKKGQGTYMQHLPQRDH